MTESLPGAPIETSGDNLLGQMDEHRRHRVKRADRRRRIAESIGATFWTTPFIWFYHHRNDMGPMGPVDLMMFIFTVSAMFGVPIHLVRAMLPHGESRSSRRRMPTFIPPPPLLDGGKRGDPWSPDREDVIFDRIRHVISAIDRRDDDALQIHLRAFAQRAGELCHPDPLGTPSSRSPYHYWPNRKTESGPSEGDTIVTYEDNHPIQHQRGRLKDAIGDLRRALRDVAKGVDRTDTSTATRDVVAILRRIVEIEGYDASSLRPDKPMIMDLSPAAAIGDLAAYDGPGADVIALVRKAVRIDPDLTDGLGNPIAPLLTRHVPSLLDTYRKAIASASDDEREEIDRNLLEGLELVRRATEEGLARHGDERRRQLRTEIAFLRKRGTEDRLLSLD